MTTAHQGEAGPVWVAGRIELRLDGGPPVVVPRPYALVGQAAGADLRVPHPDAAPRHVYLHLDRRGVFAVDLATRAGTRGGDGRRLAAAWLAPGATLEVAGHRVELLAAEVAGAEAAPGPEPEPDPAAAPPRLLTEAADRPLPRLALMPLPAVQPPWSFGSELMFLGRSSACGVPVRGVAAERVHAVVVRTPRAAYLVNLAGAAVWLDGRAVPATAVLTPGAVLTVASSRFEVRLGPVADPAPAGGEPKAPDPARTPAAPVPAPAPPPAAAPAAAWPTELVLPEGAPPPPPELFASDAQAAVLAWMMGVVQATQTEMMRRQNDFQLELIRAVRGLHEDNQAVLRQHQARVEEIHRELAALREDIRHRFGAGPTAPAAPPVPKGPPLKIPRAATAPASPEVATAWLLDRVNRLDEANRATWKDLLGRLGGAAGTGRTEP